MFTCARIKATKGKGADFYRQHLSCNDYYSEHEVVKGVWRGTLADDFQLSGKDVTQSVFSAFQQNIDPVSGKKLTARNVENAVRFYDFQCSAQKSVSIMSLFDPRIEDAHQCGFSGFRGSEKNPVHAARPDGQVRFAAGFVEGLHHRQTPVNTQQVPSLPFQQLTKDRTGSSLSVIPVNPKSVGWAPSISISSFGIFFQHLFQVIFSLDPHLQAFRSVLSFIFLKKARIILPAAMSCKKAVF